MKKIMFNNTYGLTQAVKKGLKTMTRRVLPLSEADEEYLDQAFDWDLREHVILDRYAQYEVGETVAVAESYKEVWEEYRKRWEAKKNPSDWHTEDAILGDLIQDAKGWNNKMFVRADLMPTRILFTDRKIERLRSISGEDCLKEGVMMDPVIGWYYFPNLHLHRKKKHTAGTELFESPEAAYYSLCKKLRMVLDYAANPWVIAYTFELVKGDQQ